MTVRPFISYAREDRAIALKLHQQLVSSGAAPWLDVLNLQGGQDWEVAITMALRECTHVIVLLSRHSVTKRGFVQKEIRTALELLDEFPPNSIYVIPVRLDDTEPRHERLRRLQWVDLFQDFDLGLAAILRSLNLASSRSSESSGATGGHMSLAVSRETIGEFIAHEPVVEELDGAIAARTRRAIPRDGIPTTRLQDIVVGLSDVGIHTTSELRRALVLNRREILALTEERLGTTGGDELGSGICINYLQYVLVGRSGSFDRILRYYNVLGIGFGDEQRRTFATKLLKSAKKLGIAGERWDS